jgi:succinate dehydrogenase flavin-adding protein (antitoxin of CptAB toxin-antitoxin module)
MKELDVVLERFARAELEAATSAEREALAELLELPDPLLVHYLLCGAVPAEPRLAQLVRRILSRSALSVKPLAGGPGLPQA